MKIIITEDKVEKLKELIKTQGVDTVIRLLGGWETFSKILNIETPMDFLHLFDGLHKVKSIKRPYMTLYRYTEGQNILIYDNEGRSLFVNWREMWKILKEMFGLTYSGIQKLIQKWTDLTSPTNIHIMYDGWPEII